MHDGLTQAITTAGHQADSALLDWLDRTDELDDDEMPEAPDAWFEPTEDDTNTQAEAETAQATKHEETNMSTTTETTTQTATEPTAKPKAKADAPPRFCLSGSGQQVSGKSRFTTGADATLKGILQRHARGALRDTDPTLAHLAATFEANTEDATAHARVNDALAGWNGSAADFETEGALEAHPAFVLATAVNPKWARFITPKPVRKPRKRARKQVTRIVGGRWPQTGHVEGKGDERVLVWTTKNGDEKRTPWASTKPVPEPEGVEANREP